MESGARLDKPTEQNPDVRGHRFLAWSAVRSPAAGRFGSSGCARP
jgi:hypothetical protein